MRLFVGIITLVAISSTAFAQQSQESCSANLMLSGTGSYIELSNTQDGLKMDGSCVDNFVTGKAAEINGMAVQTKLNIVVGESQIPELIQKIVSSLRGQTLNLSVSPVLGANVQLKAEIVQK